MSLDKHSLGDGAPHSWGVPALRPLPARRQAHWRLTHSGCLPLISSGDVRPSLAKATTCGDLAYSLPHRSAHPSREMDGLTRNSLHLSGLASPNYAGRTG